MADPTRPPAADTGGRAAAAEGGGRAAERVEPEEVGLLLVDDRPENLLALEAILEPLGQRMVRAQSGDEALKQLLARDFAVILLDVQMPGLNGFETARLIKARERSRHIPIIFLTAINKDEAHAFKGYEVGAVDYMAKPFEPDVLRSKVAVFVDLYRKQQQLKRQEEQLRESERRELQLRHRAELLEREAAVTAKLAKLNAELQRRQTELQHAMTARNRFYASMSHELRTPINAIIGYATLLLDDIYGPLNDRQRQGLQRSQKAATHLLELVNDVLDLSKIEAGKIELSLQPVAFPALVEELFVTMRPLADEHGSTLALEVPDGAASVVTDPRRVRQILLNLLSNAIKFGDGRPIEVRCTPVGDGIAVEVRDHGAGIAPEHLERIFDEFVQLGAPGPLVQGTGLGLPISQRLARLLGGDLTVVSALEEGSTFRLELPAVTAERGVAGEEASAERTEGRRTV